MKKVECVIQGYGVNFDQAREIGRLLADEGNDFSSLVSWCDREKGVHSPCCLKCELDGEPGWEVYGRNHGGRLRISFDGDRFVFIYS
jgi:Domain of unknown function (DUF5619)